MAKTTARLATGFALLVPFFAGCSLTPINRDRVKPPINPDQKPPDAAALVSYLNQNAQKVQSVRATVAVNAKQGKQQIGLDGLLACQKPLDFRLKAKVMGKPAVDIGSNNDEFWYWISQDNPPYVYHASYRDLSTGKVNLPFPFHPDMVVAALGIAEYDPAAKYDLKVNEHTVELSQEAKALTGEMVRRVTVFRKVVAAPGEPQVVGHGIVDARGKLVCRAKVEKVTVDRATGATVPTKVNIEWPAQEMSMLLILSDVQTNALDKTIAGRLFNRGDLTGESFDLAAGRRDRPSSIRGAGALMPARR